MNNLNSFPQLTEYKTKNILNNTLIKCNKYKTEKYNKIFNIFLFLLFLTIFIILIYWKKKTKITDEEKEKKKEQYKNYVLEKIKSVEKNNNTSLITNLPEFKTF